MSLARAIRLGKGCRVPALSILVADDHDLVRRGVKTVLEEHPEWQVCAEARTGLEAVARGAELRPDIAVLDFRMPGLNGLDAAKRILEVSPGTEILILSVDHSEHLIREMIVAGVHAFVPKEDSDRQLIQAVEALENHKLFFSQHAGELLSSAGAGAARATMLWKGTLTSREREMVRLIAEGKNTREAAEILGISAKTADTHRSNLMRKLQIHSVSGLVRYAIRNRMVNV